MKGGLDGQAWSWWPHLHCSHFGAGSGVFCTRSKAGLHLLQAAVPCTGGHVRMSCRPPSTLASRTGTNTSKTSTGAVVDQVCSHRITGPQSILCLLETSNLFLRASSVLTRDVLAEMSGTSLACIVSPPKKQL